MNRCIGVLFLMGFLWTEPRAAAWIGAKPIAIQICMAVAFAVLMLFLSPGYDKNCLSTSATILGYAVRLILERRFVRFDSGGSFLRRLFRYLLGAVLLMVLYIGLKVLFSGLSPKFLFRFVRYAVIGFFIVLGAPWIFVKTRLAG